MFTPFPYLNHYYKYVGLILTVIGLAMTMIPSLSTKYNEWLVLIGLFTIAYSKDKSKESELIKGYRYNSFRITFAIGFIVLLIIAFRNIVADYSNEINVVYSGIGYVVLYLISYYIQILTRINKFETDQDIKENYQNNKFIYYAMYLILILIIIASFVLWLIT